jgi:antitoxin (DNA-binding transcriptional repressor) of toxin-antitoxin stability system
MDTQLATCDVEEKIADVLDRAKNGERVQITRDGIAVAEIALSFETPKIDREAIKKALFERLATQPNLNLPKFTRDEIYDDDF